MFFAFKCNSFHYNYSSCVFIMLYVWILLDSVLWHLKFSLSHWIPEKGVLQKDSLFFMHMSKK